MNPERTFVCSFAIVIVLLLASAGPAIAQSASPSPAQTVPSAAPSGVLSPGVTASPTASSTGSPAAGTPGGKKPGPPVLGGGGWGKYMAVAMIGISALTLLALLAGFAIQAPGFRRADEYD